MEGSSVIEHYNTECWTGYAYRDIRGEEDGIGGNYLVMSENILVVCGVNGCTGGVDKGEGVPGTEAGHVQACGLEGEKEQ